MQGNLGFHELIDFQLNQVEAFIRKGLSQEATSTSQEYMDYILQTAGKMIRPSLVLLSAQAITGKSSQDLRLIQASAGLELIHIASLIHDDIIDEAEIRRQNPTVSKKFGFQPALILGIQLYAIALKWLSNLEIWKVIQTVSGAVQSMCEGEFIQFKNRYEIELPREKYFSILKHKTADLFSAACLVGGYIAGASLNQEKILREFGHYLGMVFQLTDDYLDIMDHENILKKEVQQDFKTGQLTLPIVLLLETKPKNERLLFFKEICTLSIQELRSLILLNGIDKQLYDQAVFYENEAIKILLKLDKNKFSEALMNLIKFISLRIKK